MLDYSIRGPLALPYHLGFMVGLAEEGHLAESIGSSQTLGQIGCEGVCKTAGN
jgi:hypothetical protein